MTKEEKLKKEIEKAKEMGIETYIKTRKSTVYWYVLPIVFFAGVIVGWIV